jgi:Sulfotransferase domain
MSLSVIGSGFGRTGTKSLKEALEQLGFGPCHHMHENVEHPELVPHWQAVAAGNPVDWNTVFAGYNSQVDWPGAHVWRELAAAFPNAKVVHSVRPAEAWWDSFSKTIGKLGVNYKQIPVPPHIKNMMDAAFEMIGNQTFGGKMADRNSAVAAFNLRTKQVRETIPAERLLVFDVAEGWEPLCRFLGVPTPDTPFPHRNLRGDFWEVFGGEPV